MHWRLFRPINLAIIGILQTIVQYNVIEAHLPDSVILFENWQFALIVMITMCAGAAGYVVNDIYDVDIDAHNKPGKNVIGRITKRRGWMIYIALALSGLVLTYFLGNPYRMPGIIFYSGATIILWTYSSYFKRQPLVGNIIVSIFSALVVYVVWLGQSINIPTGIDVTFPQHIIIMFTGFAFATTLLREIVKDVEDLSGDKFYGARTLPAVTGVKTSKFVCIAISVVLSSGIFYWLELISPNISQLAFWYMILAVILPMIALIWFIGKAEGAKAWHFISQYIKVVILAGTLFLVLI